MAKRLTADWLLLCNVFFVVRGFNSLQWQSLFLVYLFPRVHNHHCVRLGWLGLVSVGLVSVGLVSVRLSYETQIIALNIA